MKSCYAYLVFTTTILLFSLGTDGGKTTVSLNAAQYKWNLTFTNEVPPAKAIWTKNWGGGRGNENYPILGALAPCSPGDAPRYVSRSQWLCSPLTGEETDTLKGLAESGLCAEGSIAKVGANNEWICAEDRDVCPDLTGGLECLVGGQEIWNASLDSFVCRQESDLLAGIVCSANDTLKIQQEGRSDSAPVFACGTDSNADTLRDLSCVTVGNTPTYGTGGGEGQWVCSSRCADGLKDLNCRTGQVPVNAGSGWSCGAPFTNDACLDFAGRSCKAGSIMGVSAEGSSLVCAVDTGGLFCRANEWPVYNGTSRSWSCGADKNTDKLANTVCAAGQVLKWSSSAKTFQCGNDSNALASFSCGEGQIPKKGSDNNWRCTEDRNADVLRDQNSTRCAAIAARGAQPLLAWKPTQGGTPGAGWECAADCNSIGGLSCTPGQVSKWNADSGEWQCGADGDALVQLGCPPGSAVQWNASAAAWKCTPFTDTLATLSCSNGQLPKFNGTANAFACGSDANPDTLRDIGCTNGQTVKFSLKNRLGWVCALDNNGDTLRDLGCPNGQVPVYQATQHDWSCGPSVVDRNSLASLRCSAGAVPKVNDAGQWSCGSDVTCSNTSRTLANNPTVLINSGKAVLTNSFFYPVKDTSLDWGSRTGLPPVMLYPGYIIGLTAAVTKTGLRPGSSVTFTITINSVPLPIGPRITSLSVDPSQADNLPDTATLALNSIVFPSPISFVAGDTIGYQISTNQEYAVGSTSKVDAFGTLFVTLLTN